MAHYFWTYVTPSKHVHIIRIQEVAAGHHEVLHTIGRRGQDRTDKTRIDLPTSSEGVALARQIIGSLEAAGAQLDTAANDAYAHELARRPAAIEQFHWLLQSEDCKAKLTLACEPGPTPRYRALYEREDQPTEPWGYWTESREDALIFMRARKQHLFDVGWRLVGEVGDTLPVAEWRSKGGGAPAHL